jgi:alkylated DNA nucleotide flippase Atl1
MARFKTDSAEERARIIGKAFKQLMDELKVDLERVVKAEIQSAP